jgi:hypothetical protein
METLMLVMDQFDKGLPLLALSSGAQCSLLLRDLARSRVDDLANRDDFDHDENCPNE